MNDRSWHRDPDPESEPQVRLRLTKRGRAVLVAVVVLLGLLLGLTAHLWNPYTKGLDRLEQEQRVTCFEDGSCDNGWCEPGALCDDSLDA